MFLFVEREMKSSFDLVDEVLEDDREEDDDEEVEEDDLDDDRDETDEDRDEAFLFGDCFFRFFASFCCSFSSNFIQIYFEKMNSSKSQQKNCNSLVGGLNKAGFVNCFCC